MRACEVNKNMVSDRDGRRETVADPTHNWDKGDDKEEMFFIDTKRNNCVFKFRIRAQARRVWYIIRSKRVFCQRNDDETREIRMRW